MSTNIVLAKHKDIWLVNFDPTIGAEVKKTRPAVVISADYIGKLPIKLVAPITDWKSHYAGYIWFVKLKKYQGWMHFNCEEYHCSDL